MDSHQYMRKGEFHGQGDAKRIVIRWLLGGHNDMPFGWPAPGRPVGRLGAALPPGVFGDFIQLLLLVILFLNIVPLIVEFTESLAAKRPDERQLRIL
jgi:hypothetical protein